MAIKTSDQPKTPGTPGTPGTPTPTRGTYVQSVDRAVALLRAVAAGRGPDLTATALARTCDLNRATAWRLLTTLESQDFVRCDRSTGQWSIGVGVIELAGTSGLDALMRSAHTTLDQLSRQTGETAALGLVRSGRLTYVDEVTPSSVVAATWRGRTVPLHATSSGKAVLAFLPTETRERLLVSELPRFTTQTICDLDALTTELTQIREVGYGVCRGEYEVSAFGVSAPVLDAAGYPLAVLSVWGPSERLTEDRFAALGDLVVEAAGRLTRRA